MLSQRTTHITIRNITDYLRIEKGAWFEVVALSPAHAEQYPNEVHLVGKKMTRVSDHGFLAKERLDQRVYAMLYGAKVKVFVTDLIKK